MSARADLGLGDTYGQLDEPELRCECGAAEDFDVEFCRHDACPMCREASECCIECQTCRRFSDGDEFEDDTCVDCAVAAMERAEAQRESDLVALEAKGDELRDAGLL